MSLLFVLLLLFSCFASRSATWRCSCWIAELSALAGWWWWPKRETKALRHLFVLYHIQSKNPSASVKRLLRLRSGTFIQLQLWDLTSLTTYPAERRTPHLLRHRTPWKAGISNLIKIQKKFTPIPRELRELRSFSSSFELTTVKLSQVAADRHTSLSVFSLLSLQLVTLNTFPTLLSETVVTLKITNSSGKKNKKNDAPERSASCWQLPFLYTNASLW